MSQNGKLEPIIQVTDVAKKFTVGGRDVTILKGISYLLSRHRRERSISPQREQSR
jgi:hypothetical protein